VIDAAGAYRALTYTFDFTRRGKRVRHDRRRVSYPQLLRCFDAAAAWQQHDPQHRTVHVAGPGLARTPTDGAARAYILDGLVDHVPIPRPVVALAWLRLPDGGPGVPYGLYKLWVHPVWLPDFDAPGLVHHGRTPIDPTQWRAAIAWAHERDWEERGLWTHLGPALTWYADGEAAEDALLAMASAAQLARLDDRLLRAPARYDPKCATDYPMIATNRSTAAIKALRARYPEATEDLAVAPLAWLRQRYGDHTHVENTTRKERDD
jgi:hypothetical protein